MSDAVHNPSHYERGGMRCDEVMAAMLTPEQQVGYWYGCAIKYVWRWPVKHRGLPGKIEDLEKAIECIKRLEEAALEIFYEGDSVAFLFGANPDDYTMASDWMDLADKAEKKIAELKNDLHFYRQKAEEQHYEEALAAARAERGAHE